MLKEPRRSAYQRGYTKQWDRAAKAFRQRYPLCGMRPEGQPPVMSRCYDEGLTTPATHTDHVEPHRGNRAVFWDDTQWQSLCASCHNAKTQAGL